MTVIVNRETEEKVASFEDGAWKFFDEELQRRVETLMIEGIEVLGGTPVESEEEQGPTISDAAIVLMPEDEGFDERFWPEALGEDYVFEETPAEKGGPGSGHHGHTGRPGQRGGSSSVASKPPKAGRPLGGRGGTGTRYGYTGDGMKFVKDSEFKEDLYWGTPRPESVLEEGIRPSADEVNWCPGISLGRTAEESYAYHEGPGGDGAIFRVKVFSSNPVEYGSDKVKGWDGDIGGFYDLAQKQGFDAVYGPGEVRVFNADQVMILGSGMRKWRPFDVSGEIEKGGEGSGHHGHAGRPGQRGGSAAVSTIAPIENMLYGFEGDMKKRAAAVLGSVPREHLQHLSSVNLLTSHEIVVRVGPGHKNSAGLYNTNLKTPEVILNSDTKSIGDLLTPYSHKTLLHEVGHGVLHKLNPRLFGSAKHVQAAGKFGESLLTGDMKLSQVRRKINSMYKQVAKGERGTVSEYARTDVREWFSESYAYYVKYPGNLKSADAEMYGFLKANLFGGKEYGAMAKAEVGQVPEKIMIGKPTITEEDGALILGDPDEFVEEDEDAKSVVSEAA